MSDIRQLDKVSNLWPTATSRTIEKSGQRDQPSKKNHDSKSKKRTEDTTEDGPGKNIDEYA